MGEIKLLTLKHLLLNGTVNLPSEPLIKDEWVEP